MGRTVPAFRPALEGEISSWDEFKRGLRPVERELLEQLMNYARVHADAGSLAARPDLSQILFISMILEQQKEIIHLKDELNELKESKN